MELEFEQLTNMAYKTFSGLFIRLAMASLGLCILTALTRLYGSSAVWKFYDDWRFFMCFLKCFLTQVSFYSSVKRCGNHRRQEMRKPSPSRDAETIAVRGAEPFEHKVLYVKILWNPDDIPTLSDSSFTVSLASW